MNQTEANENAITAVNVYDASIYLNAAFFSFNAFYETYLYTEEGVQDLISDLKNNYDAIEGQLFSISHMMLAAKIELDTYVDPESRYLKAFLRDAEDKKLKLSARVTQMNDPNSAFC